MKLVPPRISLFAGLCVALAAMPFPVLARGCIKGALVGGVAGHYAGHHGVLGAVGGCIVGRHMANQQARDAEQRRYEQQTGPQPYRDPGL